MNDGSEQSSRSTDPHSSSVEVQLLRFVHAQEHVYPAIRNELVAGKKLTHWMWFIFPQIQGLGRSETARHFAIKDLQEAIAYLSHPVLSTRLRACTDLVNQVEGKTAREIFGSPDDLKFRSCMTLFEQAARISDKQEDIFCLALKKYFGSEPDPATLQQLGL